LKKLLYFILALSFIIWFGGSLTRNVLIFDLFLPAQELTLKPDYSDDIINYNIYLFTSTSIYTSVSYIITFVLFAYQMFSERRLLKSEGWLFMSVILFFLVSPIVIYNIYMDFTLSRAIYFSDYSYLSAGSLSDTIIMRYGNQLNTVLSGIAYLANLNVLAYFIIRPLSRPDNFLKHNE